MKNTKIVTTLVLLIAVFAVIATLADILSNNGVGEYGYESIRGHTITIYGKGLY